MVQNFLVLLIFILLLAGFIWITRRAWKARNGAIRWGGAFLAGLFSLVLLLLAVVYARGLSLVYMPRRVPAVDIQVAATADLIARGQHLAAINCASCHNPDGELPLIGGKNLAADTGMPLGDIYPRNLTPAGDLASWTDGDIARAIRSRVAPDGRPLLMPVVNFRNLSDADVQAIVAYLRSQPSVQNPVPPTRPSPLTILLAGAGLIPIDTRPVTGPVVAPEKAATSAYGQYIVSYSDCQSCHGVNLDGQVSPPFPAGPNLRVVKGWTQDQFFQTMRTGIDPSGHALQPPMPWKQVGSMDDVELAALYTYLHSLPPVASR